MQFSRLASRALAPLGGALWLLASTPAAVLAQAPASDASPSAATAQAPDDSPPQRERPTKLGPFALTLPDGSRLAIGFAGQVQAKVDHSLEAAQGTAAGVRLRRVRLYLRGTFLDGRLKVLSQLSFLPGNPEAVDLWAQYAFDEAFALRVGQMKVPFTRHRNRAFAQLPLVDWDVAAASFGAERQIGAMARGAAGSFSYGLGVYAGPNARAAFENGIAVVYAQRLPSRSSLRLPFTKTELHPEVVGQVGYTTKGMDTATVSDPEGGRARVYLGLSGAWDAQPEVTQDFLARVAPEFMLKARHLTLNLLAFGGLADGAGSDTTPALWGGTAEATYRLHPRYELAVRYSRTDNSHAMLRAARAHVDTLVSEASDEEAEAVREAYAGAGQIRGIQETVGGLNVYVVGRSLAFQCDFGWIHFERNSDYSDLDELRARLQAQVVF